MTPKTSICKKCKASFVPKSKLQVYCNECENKLKESVEDSIAQRKFKENSKYKFYGRTY